MATLTQGLDLGLKKKKKISASLICCLYLSLSLGCCVKIFLFPPGMVQREEAASPPLALAGERGKHRTQIQTP